MIKEKDLKILLSKSFDNHVSLKEVKPSCYQIFLPYFHEDGDMIDIFIILLGNKIILTDFGKTMMRLSYYTDIESSKRKTIFESVLSSYFVKYNDGKLEIEVGEKEGLFPTIMEMITVITKISDISYLKLERTKNQFYEYFDSYIMEELSKEMKITVEKDFAPSFDKKKEYVAPYAILKKEEPILIFPILNDDKCKDVIMTLLFYKNNAYKNKSICVFNDLNGVNTRDVGRVMDLVDRPLSSFEGNKEKIVEYTSGLLSPVKGK